MATAPDGPWGRSGFSLGVNSVGCGIEQAEDLALVRLAIRRRLLIFRPIAPQLPDLPGRTTQPPHQKRPSQHSAVAEFAFVG